MFSVCILAKNSEGTLAATLDSLIQFPEVILFDTGSTDKTMEIAAQYNNVSVHKRPFTGFGLLRNEAAALAKHDWILALDSDEILSPALEVEILSLSPDLNAVYEIDFHNYYKQKRILGCGWHPERHVRLYHRQKTRFSNRQIHEGVETFNLTIARLKAPIYHTPYRSISDFLAKMQHYSDLFAEQYKGQRSSSFSKALGHGAAAFFRSYFLKRGLFLGPEGFIISFYNGATAFYKYLKLAEVNRSR